jgi:hypothetical protein
MDFTTKKYVVLVNFSTNWHFSVKSKANTIEFSAKNWKILKPEKNSIQDQEIHSLGQFFLQTNIFGKIEGSPLDIGPKFEFFQNP